MMLRRVRMQQVRASAQIGAALLSVSFLISMLGSCRRESPEGGAAARDTLDLSEPVPGGAELRQPSSEGKPAVPESVDMAGDAMSEPPQALMREENAAAYAACRDSVEAALPAPGLAVWPAIPDTIAPAETVGRYRIVAQVRPDSISPGVPFLCVVQRNGESWAVVMIQGGPGAPSSP